MSKVSKHRVFTNCNHCDHPIHYHDEYITIERNTFRHIQEGRRKGELEEITVATLRLLCTSCGKSYTEDVIWQLINLLPHGNFQKEVHPYSNTFEELTKNVPLRKIPQRIAFACCSHCERWIAYGEEYITLERNVNKHVPAGRQKCISVLEEGIIFILICAYCAKKMNSDTLSRLLFLVSHDN
jgi:hypothetical protein